MVNVLRPSLLTVLILCCAHSVASAPDEYIQKLIQELPHNSTLRRDMLAGARGDGIRRPWMGPMQKEQVKRATVSIAIEYNRRGRPKKLRIQQIQYFSGYEDATPISDAQRLSEVRVCGLEKLLSDVALQKAAQGTWVDVPRPKPHPFIGGTKVDFFDNEWLPVVATPALCAGPYCLEQAEPSERAEHK